MDVHPRFPAYFTQDQWDKIFSNLNSNCEYIILPQKRLSEKNYSNYFNLRFKYSSNQELITFHKKSKYRFHDKIPYGSSPKAEMLRFLKVPENGILGKIITLFMVFLIETPRRKFSDLSSVIRLNSQNKSRVDSVKTIMPE